MAGEGVVFGVGLRIARRVALAGRSDRVADGLSTRGAARGARGQTALCLLSCMETSGLGVAAALLWMQKRGESGSHADALVLVA